MNHEEATARLLDAAETLFYERGIRAVGMDEVRDVSGVSLKRLYQCFASKEQLVTAYLRRRDQRWRQEMAEYVERNADSAGERVEAVFDWLSSWFRRPGFRGCAFVNAAGELGAASPPVVAAARDHKSAVRDYLGELVRDLGCPDAEGLADELALLVEGGDHLRRRPRDSPVRRGRRAMPPKPSSPGAAGTRPGEKRSSGRLISRRVPFCRFGRVPLC